MKKILILIFLMFSSIPVFSQGFSAPYHLFLRRDGKTPMTGNLDLNGYKIINISSFTATVSTAAYALNASTAAYSETTGFVLFASSSNYATDSLYSIYSDTATIALYSLNSELLNGFNYDHFVSTYNDQSIKGNLDLTGYEIKSSTSRNNYLLTNNGEVAGNFIIKGDLSVEGETIVYTIYELFSVSTHTITNYLTVNSTSDFKDDISITDGKTIDGRDISVDGNTLDTIKPIVYQLQTDTDTLKTKIEDLEISTSALDNRVYDLEQATASLRGDLETHISIADAKFFDIITDTTTLGVNLNNHTSDSDIHTTAQNKKLAINTLATGILNGGEVTVNADPTKFDVAAGTGIVVNNHTDPINPTYTLVKWPAFNVVSPIGLATDQNTYVGINASGNLVQQTTPFTYEQKRDIICLAKLIHTDNTIIYGAASIKRVSFNVDMDAWDFMSTFGSFNVSGNFYSPSNNLSMKKMAGQIFRIGANYDTSKKRPSIVNVDAQDPVNIVYLYRDGVGGWITMISTTSVYPNIWDDNSGSTVAVTSDYWTIQPIFTAPLGYGTYIQLGQVEYATKEEAVKSISVPIELNPALDDTVLRGWLVVKQGAYDLSLSTQAVIYPAGKFGFSSVIEGTSKGEVNTASNIGVGGVGLFDQKLGSDLQFKNINAKSNKIQVIDDTINKEVDIDVIEENIVHGNISSTGTYSHAEIDSKLNSLNNSTITLRNDLNDHITYTTTTFNEVAIDTTNLQNQIDNHIAYSTTQFYDIALSTKDLYEVKLDTAGGSINYLNVVSTLTADYIDINNLNSININSDNLINTYGIETATLNVSGLTITGSLNSRYITEPDNGILISSNTEIAGTLNVPHIISDYVETSTLTADYGLITEIDNSTMTSNYIDVYRIDNSTIVSIYGNIDRINTSTITFSDNSVLRSNLFMVDKDTNSFSTTGTTYVEVVRATITVSIPALYKVSWFCEVSAADDKEPPFIKVEADGSIICSEAEVSVAKGGIFSSVSGVYYDYCDSGTHYVTLSYRAATAGKSVSIRNVIIILEYLGDSQ